MGFLRKIKNNVQDGVEDTKFKADQYIRIQRIQGEINSLSKDISRLRGIVADKVVELFSQGTLTQPELMDLCQTLDNINKQITQHEAQIALIRAEVPSKPVRATSESNPNMKNCPNCQAHIAIEVQFCTNCGYLFKQLVEEDKSDQTSSETQFLCSKCGNTLVEGTQFCTNCGQAVKP